MRLEPIKVVPYIAATVGRRPHVPPNRYDIFTPRRQATGQPRPLFVGDAGNRIRIPANERDTIATTHRSHMLMAGGVTAVRQR